MTEREIAEQIVLRLGMTRSITSSKMMCHCPYHVDRHPSCSVDLEKSIWHCFSCSQGGTLRQLFRDIRGNSINRELGIPWENQKETEFINPFKIVVKEKEEDYLTQPKVNIALDGFFIAVKDNSNACKYLANRCIPVKVAENMKMQYAVEAKSYDTLNPNDKKKWVYFSKRLVIPVYENGKLMTCEGRDIFGKEYFYNQLKRQGKSVDDYEYKKCIYPKGSSTSTLFDIDKLNTNNKLFFLEGIMDLAVLRTSSFFNNKNSTSVFGASISKRQYMLLSKFKNTNFLIDNDYAGWLSLKKWGLFIKEHNIQGTHEFTVPPFKDLGVKDVGDIPVKSKKTIDDCLNAKWLKSSKIIINNLNYIDEQIDFLKKEKLKLQGM